MRLRRRRDRSAWVQAHREVSAPVTWFLRALGLFLVILLTPIAAGWGALRGALVETLGAWRQWWRWCAFGLLLTLVAMRGARWPL